MFRVALIELLAFLSNDTRDATYDSGHAGFLRFASRHAVDELRDPARPSKSVHSWPIVPHPLLHSTHDVQFCAVTTAALTPHTTRG